MLSDEEGVKAIVFLQMMAGVQESEEVALKNWQAMSDLDKEHTEIIYNAFQPLVGEDICIQN